jgi:hypothetical protein
MELSVLHQRAADLARRHRVLAMTFIRALWAFDFLGAIYLMVDAAAHESKIICGLGFIIGLTCLVMVRKLRDE